MDIQSLKTFLEVYRTRHFGKAADNLYLSQSAVSARIRILEQSVGVPLFTRDRKNIQLTAAGQKFLVYAESILTTWNRARQEIGVEEHGQIPFVVGCMPSVWDLTLNGWLKYMEETCPEQLIHLEVDSQEVLVRRLLEGTMDIAFVFDAPQISELEIVEITHIPLVLLSSHRGLTIENVFSDGGYILVDWGSSFATSHARYFPEHAQAHMRVTLGRIARDHILNHGGSAYLAESMLKDELKNKSVFRVKDAPKIERQAFALFPLQSEKKETLLKALQYYTKKKVVPLRAVSSPNDTTSNN